MIPDIPPMDVRSPQAVERAVALGLCGRGRDIAPIWTACDLWDRAACIACDLGVGGMLDERLAADGVAMPDSARRILVAYRTHIQAAAERQERCLAPVVDAFGERGVPFLLIKGLALRATICGKGDLRPMGDADVLIHDRDLSTVRRLLKDLYARPQAEFVHPDYFPRFYYECPYLTSDAPPLRIDLHVRPFRPVLFRHTVPAEAMWLAPRSFSLLGRSVWTPGLDETLIHLCVHAAVHGLGELRWLYDIFLLAEREGWRLDAQRIASLAESWRLSWAMRRALTRVIETFAGAAVLAQLTALRDRLSPRATWLERLALRQAPRDAVHPVSHLLVDTLSLATWRDRRAYLSMHLRSLPSQASSRGRRSASPVRHARRWLRGLLQG